MSDHEDVLAFPPPHPGAYVREIKDELEMTDAQLARHLGVGRASVSALINGKRAVTVEMAIRLGQAFQNGARFWLALQTQHDLWKEERRGTVKVLPIRFSDGEVA